MAGLYTFNRPYAYAVIKAPQERRRSQPWNPANLGRRTGLLAARLRRPLDAKHLLAYVPAEQEWISSIESQYSVQPGDVVVDVGAHVGTFTQHALARGASHVIMVEPDPINQECIRRNYRDEIRAGKATLAAIGAWSSESSLEFSHRRGQLRDG